MNKERMITASEFCVCHNIELSFICSLSELGLIDITVIEEEMYVPANQLRQLEQLVRLRHEMDINIEGIETISYLLQRLNNMQQQIITLNNRLAFYNTE